MNQLGFLVVWVTNFVAAGSHSKNRSLTSVSFYRQLQTSLATHVQTVCLGCRMSYFILSVLQILFINCR